MKAMKLYLDTSVFGALFDSEDSARVQTTRSFLERLATQNQYIVFISNVVVEEIDRAPQRLKDELKVVLRQPFFNHLRENDECSEMTQIYLDGNALGPKQLDDARHVALAVVNGIDVIVSWNCKHMANIDRKRKLNALNLLAGYRQIDIVTPLEVALDD